MSHRVNGGTCGVVAAVLLSARLGHAVVAGGGPATTDCAAVWDGVTATKGATAVLCHDGDPACDADATVDGACTFGVNVCLLSDAGGACAASAVSAVTVSSVLSKAGTLVTTPLVAPAVPASEPTCGSAAVVRLPLRSGKRGQKPSAPLQLRMRTTATVAGHTRKDADRLTLRCLPSDEVGECPANAAGGPRELQLVAANAGTDLDIGWTGDAQSIPIVGGSTLRLCLADCDTATNPHCTATADAGPGTKNPAFGPPLPTFVLGASTCLVNRYAAPISGTVDLSTGAVDLELLLSTDIYLTPANAACPQCSGQNLGDTGRCLSGADVGRVCKVDGTVLVNDANPSVFRLSSSCRPDGTPVAKLAVPLHVTTGTRTLSGDLPCSGQLESNKCPGGTCGGVCTGKSCSAMVPDTVDPAISVCADQKGGFSQECCATESTRPCFPPDATRVGRTAVLASPWPDPTYPKTADPVLVDTFCLPGTGSTTLDNAVNGLPGPGAIVLPMHACYRDTQPCP